MNSFSITFSIGPRAKTTEWRDDLSYFNNIGIYKRDWKYGYRFVVLWFAVIITIPEYDEVIREVSGFNEMENRENEIADLKSQIKTINKFLRDLPESSAIEKMSLESRKEALNKELRTIKNSIGIDELNGNDSTDNKT